MALSLWRDEGACSRHRGLASPGMEQEPRPLFLFPETRLATRILLDVEDPVVSAAGMHDPERRPSFRPDSSPTIQFHAMSRDEQDNRRPGSYGGFAASWHHHCLRFAGRAERSSSLQRVSRCRRPPPLRVHTRHESKAPLTWHSARHWLPDGRRLYSVVPGPGFLNSAAALCTAFATNALASLHWSARFRPTGIGKGYGLPSRDCRPVGHAESA